MTLGLRALCLIVRGDPRVVVEGYPSSVCEGGPSTRGGRVVYVMLFEGLHVMHAMYFLFLTEGASNVVVSLSWPW